MESGTSPVLVSDDAYSEEACSDRRFMACLTS